MEFTATNPDPGKLPTLGVWQDEEQEMTYVSSSFPNAPNFTCDSWCYESAVDLVDASVCEGGGIVLRHRVREHPQVLLVTRITPEPGAVEFAARAELDATSEGEMPDGLLTPNLCWQLKNAPDFASRPEPYPQFVERCFIFTDEGSTFLHRTERLPIPVRAADDPYNNPPWVQTYLPVWETPRPAGPQSWAANSPTRYAYPVIGAVSRDGKYLTAIANARPVALCQAWHDCMHNNPAWLPAEEGEEKMWRLKIYVMENDPEELLHRVGEDFPGVLSLKENRVPAG